MTLTPLETDESIRRDKRSARFWIGLVGVIFVLQMSGAATLIYFAHSDAGFAVEPDYYARAQNWNETAALRAASDALGWRAGLSIGEEVGPLHNREVTITLLDSTGKMLPGATVVAEAMFNARASNPKTLTLKETTPGVYVAPLVVRRVGLWIFTIRAQRNDEVFVQEIRTDIYPSRKGSA